MIRPIQRANRAIPAILATALAVTAPARAGSIVQTIAVGPTTPTYAQFNPALGSLNAVGITVTGTWSTPTFTVSNPPGNQALGQVLICGYAWTDAGNEFMTEYTYLSIPGTSTVPVSKELPFAIAATFTALTTLPGVDFSQWIGTGSIAPVNLGNASVAPIADNFSVAPNGFIPATLVFTETITYYFGDTIPTPEPASIVMMGMGMMLVGVWRVSRPG